MADFRLAFAKTLQNEGGFTNDPLDRGGMTYLGVSRRFFPDWKGWEKIDAILSQNRTPDLNDKVDLMPLAADHYKVNFWDIFKGDQILSQQVAEEVFDTGVNMGVRFGIKILQRALNLLNRNQQSWPNIAVDGICGSGTLNTLNLCLQKDEQILLVILNVLQGMRYIEIMENDPSQTRFCRGWFSRVMISKE